MRLRRNPCEDCPIRGHVEGILPVLEVARDHKLKIAGLRMATDHGLAETEEHQAALMELAADNVEVADLVSNWRTQSFDQLLDVMNPEIEEPIPGIVIKDERHREQLIRSMRQLLGIDSIPRITPEEATEIRNTLERLDEAEVALAGVVKAIGKGCRGPKENAASIFRRSCSSPEVIKHYVQALDLANLAVKSDIAHSNLLEGDLYRQF